MNEIYTLGIIAMFWSIASMFNKYQWRKAWEAYYSRPLPVGEEHKAPNGKDRNQKDSD